jgi:hypothetical protein
MKLPFMRATEPTFRLGVLLLWLPSYGKITSCAKW